MRRRTIVPMALLAAACAMSLGVPAAGAQTFNADPGSLGAIPDGAGCEIAPGEPRDVTFQASGISGAPSSVSVSFTMSPQHAWAGDLIVVLFAPNGAASKTILSRVGTTEAEPCLGDDSIVKGPYTFSDSAPATPSFWEAAAATGLSIEIPAGSYRASAPGPLSG